MLPVLFSDWSFYISRRSYTGIGYGDTINGICGTRYYMAPEILMSTPYTKAVDWWSLGVVIYIMLNRKFPFSDRDNKLTANIIHRKFTYKESLSTNATSIIDQLLKKDQTRRLGAGKKDAQDVKKHPFFQDIDWAALLLKNMTPPFVPEIKGIEDVSNFQEIFTTKQPILTPPQSQRQPTLEENKAFRDFDWMADWGES
ncbi:serine/threonine-protein kinase N2-like [Pelobates fuscus]|uniref:serine/threonine-protein kinase N2-like n=1 Tax=Pelobates fuscus TaxID=191477 RepID=UPI002FE4C6FD